MSTGYTQKLVSQGQTFPEFAITCARAMGACVDLREEPLNDKIPIFKSDGAYEQMLKEAIDTLRKMEAMNLGDCIEFGKKKKASTVSYLTNAISEVNLKNSRIEKMKNDVLAWNPPTQDHVGLKNFMAQQLAISIDSTDYYERELKKNRSMEPIEFYNSEFAEALEKVATVRELKKEDDARIARNNQWVRQLRNSLKA